MVAPFQLVGGSVAYTTDIVKQTEQKILNVLVTGKTERAGRAQYGAGVQQLLFENVAELEFTDWKIDAAEEISKNVSGVSIIDIRVEVTDDTTATVTVYYRTPLSSPRAAVYTLPINSVLTEESPL
jgi:phage baseplate assembly protein W